MSARRIARSVTDLDAAVRGDAPDLLPVAGGADLAVRTRVARRECRSWTWRGRAGSGASRATGGAPVPGER